MQHLIRVSKANEAKLPIRASTMYKWHSVGLHKEIFRKFSGLLFVDIKALEALIESGGKA
ncbi:MAG: hypothetical protein WAU47_10145 [Desulfobaccales bacterium]